MGQMTQVQQNTLKRIVEAAIELMSERGFHRVTVQEVGRKAGICEKTVFRYFATKKSLLDEIIRYRAYAKELKVEFENRRTWNLEHDLKLAARLYFQATKAKRNAFRAYLSALDSVDANGEDFLRDSRELQAFLCDYLSAMQEKGRIREGDVQLMVRAFVNLLHGYMLMYCMNDDAGAWQAKTEAMKLTIDLFVRGFSPTDRSGEA